MKVCDIIALMDDWAPPSLAFSWDRAGLALGQPSDSVSGVLTCLTVTREALRAARKARANFVVAHHPLIWEPLKTLRSDDAQNALCLELAKAGIGCYSAHTNLDVVPDGVNHILAKRLGLTDTDLLFSVEQAGRMKLVTFVPESHLERVRTAVCRAGAGVIGDYSYCSFGSPGTGTFLPAKKANPFSGKKSRINREAEVRLEVLVPAHCSKAVIAALRAAHPYEEVAYDLYLLRDSDPTISLGLQGNLPKKVSLRTFGEQVCKKLGIRHVRISGDLARKVRRVAVMGGSGGGSAANIPDGVDVFVTGDVKYHEAIDATERGLAVIDAGHHGTEKWIGPAMTDYLRNRAPKLRVTSYVEPDPFRVITPK
jgi:dinuclear metal center YbgI/SA1388 family protein